MKVYVLSDLHLEFSEFVPPPTGADLVTLAGDIDPKCRAVEWANLAFERKVIYACGNHEFHSRHIDRCRTPCSRSGEPGVLAIDEVNAISSIPDQTKV